jgi:ferritin-like metal-binding protein YciE
MFERLIHAGILAFSVSPAHSASFSEQSCIDYSIFAPVKSNYAQPTFVGGNLMARQGLKELYVDELRDLYDAENRLVKALPKLAKEAESSELRSGFEEHLEQTKGHVDRLRQIFETLGEKPSGKKCAGMVGLIEEGDEMMDEDFEDGVKDAALISAAQRVEHYEIAAYGCVKTWAGLLGETEAQRLLAQTLQEEKETDEKLTELAEQINGEACSGSEEEDSEAPKPRGKSRSARA